MTFTESLGKDGVGCDAIEMKLQRAWDAAKADCALDCKFRFAIGRIRAVLRAVDEEFDAYQAIAEINGICDEVWRAR